MAYRCFADKPIGKSPKRVHNTGNRVGGQEEDGRLRRYSPDLDSRAHAIHHWHVDIQNYDIRI